MTKFSYDDKKYEFNCSKIIGTLFLNFMNEIILHLPKFNKLGFLIQGLSQLQIATLLLEHLYNIYNSTDNPNTDTVDTFQSLLKPFYTWFNFKDLFDYEDSNITNTFTFTLIAAYLVALLLFSLVMMIFIWFKRSFSGIYGKIWGMVCFLNHSLLCAPLYGYLLKIIITYTYGRLQLASTESSPNFAVFLLSIILFIFNLLFGLIMSKLCYHQLKVKDTQAMKNSSLQVLTLVFKLIIISLFEIQVDNIKNWSVGITSLMMAIFYIQAFHKSLPFYNFRMLTYYGFSTLFILNLALISLCEVVITCYGNFIVPTYYVFIFMLVFPFQFRIIIEIMDYKIRRAATLPYSQLTSPNEIILKFLYLKRIIRRGIPNVDSMRNLHKDELYLHGVLVSYSEGKGRQLLKEHRLESAFDANFKHFEDLKPDNYD